VSEPPADILRRLRPIPTASGPPSTAPRDVAGVDPGGDACTVDVLGGAAPVLLLFLSAGCTGCLDLWDGLGQLRARLGERCRLAVVTKSPGDEDPGRIAALAGGAHRDLGIPVVMSTPAYRDYRVAGPPFLVVADATAVRTEGVAWGIDETLRAARSALGDPG
jgi:hypothetical protein